MRIDPNGTAWWEWLLLGIAVVASLAIGFAAIASGGFLGAVIAGAAFGFAFSTISNVGNQVSINGWNNVDFGEVVKSGAIGAAVGAISGVFSFGVGQILQGVGQQLGIFTSLLNISGKTVGHIFNPTTVSAVMGTVGKISGNVIGAIYGEYLGNRQFNQTYILNRDIKNTIGGEFFGWLADIYNWINRMI